MSKKHDNIFFMKLFNQILKVNDKEIMIVYDVDGNIWFKIKNILEVLGYTGTLKQLNNIKINKNNSKVYRDIKKRYPSHLGYL